MDAVMLAMAAQQCLRFSTSLCRDSVLLAALLALCRAASRPPRYAMPMRIPGGGSV